MIDGIRAFPDYEPSGIPWAPRLPQHWSVERAKRLFDKMDREVRPEDGVVTCFRDGVVTLRKNRRLRGFTEAIFELGYQGIRRGDLVIHAMDAFAGAAGVSDSDGKGTPVYAVCRPRDGVLSAYYAHVVREMAQAQWILALSRGIRERSTDFRFDMFGGQRVPLPPVGEQAAIVRFLDHANRRIERFIRAKRKLIALLNEQKQAIIHRAVTRGLDPNVPLKDSGVPWLGEIPAHWEFTKLKHVSPQITVGIVIQPARLYAPQGVPCLRSLNISSGAVTRKNLLFISDKGHQSNKKSELHSGDVVLVRTGRTGVAAIVPPECEGANCVDLLIVRTSPRLLSRYLLTYLRSYGARSDVAYNSVGAIQAHYNTATLANLRIPLPSLDEQEALLSHLDERIAPMDISIAQAERGIALIREYRTRLISDVVTGQLDVREAAARLPDDEPSAPEDTATAADEDDDTDDGEAA